MTKHDTWLFLKTPSPYDQIKELFPLGFPARDSFPMASATLPTGEKIALWVVDVNRLSTEQFAHLAFVIAQRFSVTIDEVADEALANGGFGLDHEWVEKMEIGAEGYARSCEWVQLLESHGGSPPLSAVRLFFKAQVQRWIEGDEMPPPLPQSIEEVKPSLRTPELEQAIKRNRAQQILAAGNYSVMDMLSGKAFVDVLNQLDPDSQYDIVSWDDFLGDEDE